MILGFEVADSLPQDDSSAREPLYLFRHCLSLRRRKLETGYYSLLLKCPGPYDLWLIERNDAGMQCGLENGRRR